VCCFAQMAALELAAARSARTKAMEDQIQALREERQRALAAAKKTKVCVCVCVLRSCLAWPSHLGSSLRQLESWRIRGLEDQHKAEIAEDMATLEAERVREEEREYNEERIAFREGLLEEKAEMARLAKEQAEREEEERVARLEDVARSVPYRETLDAIAVRVCVCIPCSVASGGVDGTWMVLWVGCQPDPERTRAHTIASQLAAQLGISHAGTDTSTDVRLVFSQLQCVVAEFIACGGDVRQLVGTGDKSDLAQHRLAERGFFMTEGYSNKQIFDNLQFKVGMALREAGIHNSDYARGVMLSMAREGAALKATHNFA
jgi:hypothetical protein